MPNRYIIFQPLLKSILNSMIDYGSLNPFIDTSNNRNSPTYDYVCGCDCINNGYKMANGIFIKYLCKIDNIP